MAEYKIMTGNEALTHGAIAAGMRFFAGYPITPATEIAELSSELLPKVDGTYMQMEDELAAAAAILGASAAGKKAMTATSGPGFTLMHENVGYGMATEIPCVVVDVMRQGPCQGVATLPAQGDFMAVKWAAHGDHPVIAIAPSSVAETYTEIIRAFNLSEKYRTPVFFVSDATLAHMSEKIRIPDASELEIVDRPQPSCDPDEYLPFNMEDNSIVPMANFGSGYRWFASGLIHDDTGFPVKTGNTKAIEGAQRHLLGKIEDNIEDIQKWEEYKCDDAEILILSVGLVSRSVKTAIDAAREEGIKVGLFRPITLWPFPGKRFAELTAKAKTVMTCEMNLGQLSEIAAQYTDRDQKIVAITQSDGTVIQAKKILNAIKEAK